MEDDDRADLPALSGDRTVRGMPAHHPGHPRRGSREVVEDDRVQRPAEAAVGVLALEEVRPP